MDNIGCLIGFQETVICGMVSYCGNFAEFCPVPKISKLCLLFVCVDYVCKYSLIVCFKSSWVCFSR